MARSLTFSPEKRPAVTSHNSSLISGRSPRRSGAGSKRRVTTTAHPTAKRRRLDDAVDSVGEGGTTNTLPHGAANDLNPSRLSTSQYTSRESAVDHNGMPTAASRASVQTSKNGAPSSKEEKRSLRSKDNVPPKSDLEKYFPDYQEVVFGEQQDDEFLPPETVIHITDDPPKTHSLPLRTHPSPASSKRKRSSPPAVTTSASHATSSSQASRVNRQNDGLLDLRALAELWVRISDDQNKDPLPDDQYKQAHKRAERKEKQSRNTDRERAMYEKSELERLLGDLKGPDWLRTMGISGITETQKRQLEPKRDEFIRRVKALLVRFAAWKAKEKRLKEKRDRRMARLLAQEEEDEEDEEDESEDAEGSADDNTSQGEASDNASDRRTSSHEESSRRASKSSRTAKRSKARSPPEPEESYRSFFSKPHLRAAALGNHRRGRHVHAFGQPVPDLAEVEFALPSEIFEARHT